MFKEFAEVNGNMVPELFYLIPNKPWLYCILSYSQRFIYIGETSSEQSIIQRLSEHFLSPHSSLKKNVYEILKKRNISGPYHILGYSLDGLPTDFLSKKLRIALEANVHHDIANLFSKEPYHIVSNFTYNEFSTNKAIEGLSKSIAEETIRRLLAQVDLVRQTGLKLSLLKTV